MTRPLPTIAWLTVLVILVVDLTTAAGGTWSAPIADPFAYCARLGTIDTPNGGASPVPTALMPLLRTTLGLSEEAPLTPQSYYWRCMDGGVYVCAIGANRPCASRADRTTHNTGADNYCRENLDTEFVPAYATGHNTVYEWSCAGGRAVPGKRAIKADGRGYPAEFWYRVLRH
jgi:hypothetical protein